MKDGRDPMRKVSWKVRLAGALLLLSVLLYLLQWLLFSNPGVMTVWFLNEIAFLPVEVLIVYLVFQKVFENRERRDRLRKVNMLIGIFFSDLGACALEVFAGADPDVESIRASTLMRAGWGSEDFRNACSSIEPHPFRVDPDKIDLVAFRDTLSAKRDILVKLLENPSLLEHESFSESLLSVFHVIEELDGILRRAVSRETVNNVQLSIAIGYALKNGAGGSMDEVMKQAENDMYAHKISEGSSVRNKAIQAILGTLTDKYAKEKVHSERVSRICGAIGRALNLRAAELRELEMAGLYHDIGKIAIPDVILNKPGRLTPEEFEVMKKHTEVGYQILRAADEYSDLAESALSHQERWDGTGYPRGLSGTAIPLIPRIISVADAYEAMTSDRSYRRKLTRDEALEQLRLGKGTQFDPDLVDTFLAIVTDDL
jgi:putative nucleotidyltransferase with HDIG domain